MSTCKQCGGPVEAGNVLCPSCAKTPGRLRCWKCGSESSSSAQLCYSCGTDLRSTPPASSGTTGSTGQVPANTAGSPIHRYADAYTVARTITALGATVKVVSYVVAGLVALAAPMAGGSVDSRLVGVMFIAGLIAGVITAVPIYVLGVLVSAQGQILKATVDTAVNTSPLLTPDEVRRVISSS